jgi:hypothetical protein
MRKRSACKVTIRWEARFRVLVATTEITPSQDFRCTHSKGDFLDTNSIPKSA